MTTVLSPLRTGRITGSRIGGVLGLNRYSSRDEVLAEMVAQALGQPPAFEGNDATQWGTDHERDALAAYERRAGVMTYGAQEIVIHPVHDFLAVTPDGYVGDDGMVECKCPFTGKYTHIGQKPEYEAQIRLQLECTGRQWCDFIVWRQGSKWRDEQCDVSRVEHDPAWLVKHLPTLLEFMADYRATLEAAR